MKPETSNNILTRPIIRSGVKQESRVTLCVDLFCRDQEENLVKVSSGSGFFHSREGRLFFITNWHVVTGRDPSDPSRLINRHPDSPVGFKIHFPLKDDPNHYVPSGFTPLYENGVPLWFETTSVKAGSEERIDLVAIELPYPSEDEWPLITPIEKFAPDGNDYLYIGRDVVIVGYPFGISELNPYPLWKRGYVASEPSLLMGGMPKFYIDSPGRPGMSGSPIFMLSDGIEVPSGIARILEEGGEDSALERLASLDADILRNAARTQILNFVGVYSGSVGDNNLDRLQVGVAWHAAMVDRLFSHQEKGTNPYPPACQ